MSLADDRALKRRRGADEHVSLPFSYPHYTFPPPLPLPVAVFQLPQPEEQDDELTREQMERKLRTIAKWIKDLPTDSRDFECLSGSDGAREAHIQAAPGPSYPWPSSRSSLQTPSAYYEQPLRLYNGVIGDRMAVDGDVSVAGPSDASSISSMDSIPMSDMPSSSSKTSQYMQEQDGHTSAGMCHSQTNFDNIVPRKKRRASSVASYPGHQRPPYPHFDSDRSGRLHRRQHPRMHRMRMDSKTYGARIAVRQNKRIHEERLLSSRLHDERRMLIQRFEGPKAPFLQDLQVQLGQTLQPHLHLHSPHTTSPFSAMSLTLPPIRSASVRGGFSAATTPILSPDSPTSSPPWAGSSISPPSNSRDDGIHSHEETIARLRSQDHQSRAEHDRRMQAMQDFHQVWLKQYFDRTRKYESRREQPMPPAYRHPQPTYSGQIPSPAVSAPPYMSSFHTPPHLPSLPRMAGQPMPISAPYYVPPHQQLPQLFQRHSISYLPIGTSHLSSHSRPVARPFVTSDPQLSASKMCMPQPPSSNPHLSMLNPNRQSSSPDTPVHYHYQHHHHHHHHHQPYPRQPPLVHSSSAPIQMQTQVHSSQLTRLEHYKMDHRPILPPLQLSSLQHSNAPGSLPTSPNVGIPFNNTSLMPLNSHGSYYGGAPRTA